MAIIDTRLPKAKKVKDVGFTWDNFRKGLNTLLRETEIEKDELVEADNLILKGKGVPTKRWGTALDFWAGASGSVRGLKGYYLSDGTVQLLALTDAGYLTKKSGASYSTLTGASWASGYNASMAQLNDDIYIVNGQREMVRYSTPTLSSFPTLSVPAGVFATQFSGVSGAASFSYRVSAVSSVGETVASDNVLARNCPQDLADGTVKVTWTATSAASGTLKGYNIYGRADGDERFLAFVDVDSTAYYDDGSAIPLEFTYPPLADSTGGIIAKYIIRFQDRLIFAGISGAPSKIVISGRVPNHEKFDLSYGGNYVMIEPDAGDDITGLIGIEDKIIVFKEKSIWQVTLTSQQIGNFYVTIPALQLITASHGCISPRSILPVENDVFFLSRKGVYALGYEPNILNVLRTSEISAKIRPFFENLSVSQKMNAAGFYYDFKYGLSFPGKDQSVVYDRERLAWMGPWSFDARVYENYFDSSDVEYLLYGEDDGPNVIDLNESYGTDQGTAFSTQLRTKKEDFGDWAIFKYIRNVFTLFRNVQGTLSVSIRIQDRNGELVTVKSFDITTAAVNNAGWGSGQWGDAQWADSEEAGGATDINEIYRWVNLNKAARNIQLIITTNGNDKYELLSIRATAKPMGLGFLPSSERV